MKKLNILTTGGTIEKIYNEQTGQLLNHPSSLKERILNKLRYPNLNISVIPIMDKDSLDLTPQDRSVIFNVIQSQASTDLCGMVVLHGTDTMDQTVNFVAEQFKAVSIPVIFTGAMRPLEFANSDGVQNIIEAIFAAQTVTPGIYLSFHGSLFTAHHFRKNHDLKTFESL